MCRGFAAAEAVAKELSSAPRKVRVCVNFLACPSLNATGAYPMFDATSPTIDGQRKRLDLTANLLKELGSVSGTSRTPAE